MIAIKSKPIQPKISKQYWNYLYFYCCSIYKNKKMCLQATVMPQLCLLLQISQYLYRYNQSQICKLFLTLILLLLIIRAFFLSDFQPIMQTLSLSQKTTQKQSLTQLYYFIRLHFDIIYSMQSSNHRNIGKGYQTKGALLNAKSATDLCIDTNKSYINTISSKNFQKYQVIVENQHLENELKCIEWRSKTQFPIVKVLFYKMLQKKLLNQCSVVQVAIQHFPYNLNTLPKMTFHHILYLLKESLIGYERLFDRFGPFDLTSKMILINKNSKCRVWINQNITLNFPSKRNKIAQNQFVVKLVRIFQEKCIKTNASADFFHRISNKNQIVQALQYLQLFIKTSKIVIANRITLLTQANSPKRPIQKIQESNDKPDELFGYNSLKKIPKFILELRQEKKIDEIDSKSFDSPMARKKEVNKDRSFAKTAINKEAKPKNEVESQSQSNVSPLSQISQDIKKQTKSNNENTGKTKQKILKPAVRELLKQNSQKNINTYATMRPICTDKKIEDKEKQISFILKHNNKRTRKLSNQQSLNPINKSMLNKINPIIRQQCSVLCSQQTATTIHSTIMNPKITSLVQQVPQINIITPMQQQQSTNIYQKNGWMKRLNSLTSQQQLRTTLHSHYQGQQTFSDDFLLAGQSLGILGSMGKDLKGSIVGI